MEPLTNFQEDILGNVLQSVHLRGTLYCRAKMSAPWGFHVSYREVASFHVVTGGKCWLQVEGGNMPVLLTEGDLVILPHGHAHIVSDHPSTPITRLEHLVAKQPVDKDGTFYSGGGGVVTKLVCGGLQIEDYATNPLFSILPTFIHIRHQKRQATPWLRATIELVKSEASTNRPGAETIITRLSEILFIQAVRVYISTISDGNAGWLGALKDPQIGPVLALIQHQPDEAWTVESLAKRASMSRSAFSARFKLLVGDPPLRYITHLRLNNSATYLRTSTRTLMEIARLVGYDSEVAFSKAFKRYFGIAPGVYRQGTRPPITGERSKTRPLKESKESL